MDLFKLNKSIYKIPQLRSYLSDEILKYFPLSSGTRQGCPFSLSLFNIFLEVLSCVIRGKEGIKITLIGNKENKLFADSTVLENPKEYTT